MTLRTEIENALAEIISNEEGMKFQGLAVVLAKLKWPELIACERKKDLGLDAYLPASLSKDGKGKGVACSLTATLGKITSDLDKVHENHKDLQVLIFYTPAKVTNRTAEKWASAVHEKYGLNLITVSREDVITDLMVPSNASICRSHLGIQLAVELSTTDLINKTREAISETIKGWLSNPRLLGKPRIGLHVTKFDNESGGPNEIIELSDIHVILQEGRRVVLEAPAGRGKTTTLTQLAERHLAHSELPFLIDLPAWNKSGTDLLGFVAGTREFRSRGISAEDLARLFNVVHFSFLLNGWNEVPDRYSEQGVQAIRELERSFPKAGIIIVTRSHHIKPPLPGSLQLKLLFLSRAQRTEYLEKRLASAARELDQKLDEDPILDDLTRTPLILSEVTTLFSLGRMIPRTRIGVLSAVLEFIKDSDEHRHHLALPPLSGHSENYLAELAIEMTKNGEIVIQESRARQIVHSVSLRLCALGELSQPPEPLQILGALCAHHVLERFDDLTVGYKFEHQQFQEFLATSEIKRQLFAFSNTQDSEKESRFVREYVNQPAWEESLCMIAEELGEFTAGISASDKHVAAGRRLVNLTLTVDPVFSAQLGRLCGAAVWQEVRTVIGERLRNLYAKGSEHCQKWALAGMLGSGSEDFRDILVPLLGDEDNQVSLPIYRAGHEFHISSLGQNWRSIIGAWEEAQRVRFVHEVVQERWMAHVAEDFAKSDPSPRVRMAALHAMHWAGADIALVKVLAEATPQIFERALQEGILDPLPTKLRPRAISTYQSLLKTTRDPVGRLRLRLGYFKVAAENPVEGLKSDLSGWPTGELSDTDHSLLKATLELIRKDDPHWVSHWLAKQIVGGSIWPHHWSTMLLSIPEDLRKTLLEKIVSQDLEYNEKSRAISVLAPTADAKLSGALFLRMCQLNHEISDNPKEERRAIWSIKIQLEDLYRAIPPEVAVSGMLLSLSDEFDEIQYFTSIDILKNNGHENSDIKEFIPEHVRQKLRRYLIDGVAFTLSQQDYDGKLKSSLALALARIGNSEDLEILYKLIQADINRLRRGRAARSKGEHGPMASGAVMDYSTWHVNAVTSLDASLADGILLRLLNEPEYEREASSALLRLARIESPRKDFGIRTTDYQRVWEARAGRPIADFYEARRSRYALAIKERISEIDNERSKSSKAESFIGRLKGLSKVLALLDGRNSSDSILEKLAVPQQWDGWIRIEALDALLFSGAPLPAKKILEVLNPAIEHSMTLTYNRQEADHFLTRCCCLLSFVEPPFEGIARIREIDPVKRMWGYELQGLIIALGYSRCDEALSLLMEMAKEKERRLDSVTGDWVDAVANLGTPKAMQILLSFVDPDIDHNSLELNLGYQHQERLASRIATIAERDRRVRGRLLLLCNKKLPTSMRLLLADCVTRMGIKDGMLAALDLVRDDASPSIPPALINQLENFFVEHRPHDNSGTTYTLEPQSANDIRLRLFEMATKDEGRKNSSLRILEQIESWRIEYGRPTGEPRHPNFESGISWPFLERRHS